MSLLETIRQYAAELHPSVVEIRRHLHANPELSFEEYETSALVARYLNELGIETHTGIAMTGVVGLIHGKNPGKTLALRADMDALPILEENDLPYKSTQPGKMHACGHDAHTSSLLGVANILNRLRDEFDGTVKLIFQPSEEKLPGGASVMIKEGVLAQNKVESIIGQHVMPMLETGKIGVRGGRYMASADEIYITVHGVGGHGAQPHTTVDPVLISAHLITALQQVVSRNGDPRMPSVLTIGKVIANGATNIIPPKVTMEGTFRTFNEKWRDDAHRRIESIARGVVEGMGGRLELEIRRGYPVLHNNEGLTAEVRQHIEAYMGSENVVDLDLWMASEDFAYYTQEIPGCFYRLGTRNEALQTGFGLHHPRFNLDENALQISTGLMAWLAVNQLKG